MLWRVMPATDGLRRGPDGTIRGDPRIHRDDPSDSTAVHPPAVLAAAETVRLSERPEWLTLGINLRHGHRG